MKPKVRMEYYRKDSQYSSPIRYLRGIGFLCGTHIVAGCPPLTKGGATIAHVEVDNVKCEARADCSDKDQFNYALGRTIALGRLYKLLAAIGKADDVLWPGDAGI